MKSKSFYTAKKTMYNAKKQLQNGRNFLSTIHLKGSSYLQSIRNWKKNRHQNFWLSIFSIWTNGSNIQFLKEDTQETGEMARCVKALVQTWKPGFGLSTHIKQTGKHKHVYVNGCACIHSLVLWRVEQEDHWGLLADSFLQFQWEALSQENMEDTDE